MEKTKNPNFWKFTEMVEDTEASQHVFSKMQYNKDKNVKAMAMV